MTALNRLRQQRLITAESRILMQNPSAGPGASPGADASLEQWLAYLEAIHPAEIDLGLDRVLLVFRKLFRRKPAARVITVSGTNGKGSTVAALEAVLLASGETVGCYTSPHLDRYNERVRINGAEVADSLLVDAFERIEKARGRTTLTYFEFGTLAAFLVMEQAAVSHWVLEVGLGGRLDAVNVMDADLAIITSVALDHTSWLGHDRETIGFEKAGILRQGQTAIYAEDDPPRSVLQQVAAQQVRLFRPGAGYRLETDDGAVKLIRSSVERPLRLPGDRLPVRSLAAAAVASGLLSLPIDDATLEQVLAEVSVPGRFERMAARPEVIVDVGHNPHAARWLATRLELLKPAGRQVFAVYAGLEDKDSAAVAAELRNLVDRWYLAGLQVPRGLSAEQLENRVKTLPGPVIPVIRKETVAEALDQAMSEAGHEDIVLVFGSFFTVSAARACFRKGL